MIWQIPRMWEGGECWIIGGGPSVPRVFNVPSDVIKAVVNRELKPDAYSPYFSAIHGKHVIAVNAAFLLGDWVDIIFFGDGNFYRSNRRELRSIQKIKVTCNPRLKDVCEIEKVKFVPRDNKYPAGITKKPNHVSWNKNSGASAINLAYHLGCKRIILLGFDMDLMDNQQHWHGHYTTAGKVNAKSLPFPRHLRGFGNIAQDAKRLGVEILNVSPISKIKEFKKVTLEEVL